MNLSNQCYIFFTSSSIWCQQTTYFISILWIRTKTQPFSAVLYWFKIQSGENETKIILEFLLIVNFCTSRFLLFPACLWDFTSLLPERACWKLSHWPPVSSHVTGYPSVWLRGERPHPSVSLLLSAKHLRTQQTPLCLDEWRAVLQHQHHTTD